jgi:hypothetical protein
MIRDNTSREPFFLCVHLVGFGEKSNDFRLVPAARGRTPSADQKAVCACHQRLGATGRRHQATQIASALTISKYFYRVFFTHPKRITPLKRVIFTHIVGA